MDWIGGRDIPVLPLDQTAPLPALRIHFKHRSKGLDPNESWWSAVIEFGAGETPPEWRAADLTEFE